MERGHAIFTPQLKASIRQVWVGIVRNVMWEGISMRGNWKEDEMGVVVYVASGEMPKPQVGIFWLVDGEVVKDAVSWKDVPVCGGMIRHGCHESIWHKERFCSKR